MTVQSSNVPEGYGLTAAMLAWALCLVACTVYTAMWYFAVEPTGEKFGPYALYWFVGFVFFFYRFDRIGQREKRKMGSGSRGSRYSQGFG